MFTQNFIVVWSPWGKLGCWGVFTPYATNREALVETFEA